jgi:MSHA biogenesis protein MshM
MQTQIHHEQPFARGGSIHYFFTTPALRLRLDLAREYIRAGESPVSIIGEGGAGKTAFLHQLLTRADHHWRTVKVPAVSSFSANDFMRFLNAELRLPVRESTDEMLRDLDRWLERIAVRGQIVVVAVDNAHLLRDECLMQLMLLPGQLRSDNCRVLMTGEPRLQVRLKGLQGHSQAAARGHVINIPSLDRREVASYIDMKLYHAGMEGRGPFNRMVIDQIARNSCGHPGRIDAMASAFLNGNRQGPQWRRTSGQLQRFIRRLSAFRDSRHP